MDKQAELKKKKSLTMPTQLAVPPKYQIKLAPIIATTTARQASTISIGTSLGALGEEKIATPSQKIETLRI
uniref:Uncharacterized protein n=1 Tax=Romanomermis culicivorax TaxID=13658 RepID=A0A915IA53_ROMCU